MRLKLVSPDSVNTFSISVISLCTHRAWFFTERRKQADRHTTLKITAVSSLFVRGYMCVSVDNPNTHTSTWRSTTTNSNFRLVHISPYYTQCVVLKGRQHQEKCSITAPEKRFIDGCFCLYCFGHELYGDGDVKVHVNCNTLSTLCQSILKVTHN